MLCKDTTGLMACSSTEPMALLCRSSHSEVFDFATIPLSHNNCLKEKRNYCAFANQVQTCKTLSPTSQMQFHFCHICTRTNTTSFRSYSPQAKWLVNVQQVNDTVTRHNQFLPDTDRELAQIAPALSKCSRGAILIIDELSDGSDRNKKGGTLGGLNNFEFVPKFMLFMEIRGCR